MSNSTATRPKQPVHALVSRRRLLQCGAAGLAATSAVAKGQPVNTMSATLPAGRAAAAAAAGIEALDAFIAKALVDYRVPGAAVAVVHNGQVVLQKGYGVSDATRPDAVDEHTIFQLASNTKALTGAVVASVVDEGKLEWDTPITTYLPEFVGSDPYMTRWLTLRDLLAHRTGWPAFAGDQLSSFGYTRPEIVYRLRYFEPRYSLREVAQYSNPGIFLAGEVAARAAGMSWNDLLEQLNAGTYGDTQVLTPASVAELFKRSMVSELSFAEVAPISEATSFYYGLGVASFDYGGYQIIEKSGARSGVRTSMVLIPGLQSGIVVLANLNATALPEAVRAYFINQQLGIDSNTDQQAIYELNEQLLRLFVPPVPPENPGPFPWPLQALPGTYEHPYFGSCTISLDGETLGTVFGPANYRATLRHWDNGQFVMQFPGATSGLIDTTFAIGADGTADSMTTDSMGTFTRVRP